MTAFSCEERAIIALHLLPDIGPRRFQHLVARFGSAEAALAASEIELATVEDIGPTLAKQIAGAAQGEAVDKELALAECNGARFVTCISDGYPECLKQLPDAPIVLSIKGELLPDDLAGIAVVGTRHPTAYGRTVAAQFCREFAAKKLTVVSGLARGIDTEAHTAALREGGRTIAVLGNGLNQHYPPENRKLEEKIIENGALISEFPLGFPPDRGNFPRRNRIISGLSLATVVVEADIKSGALITARFAAEQGKDVFAVPGPIFSRYSRGPHSLLKTGAQLAECADDIICEIQQVLEWHGYKKQQPDTVQEDMPLIDNSEEMIINILDREPAGASIDAMAARLALPAGELAAHLLSLELKGLVRSLPGKMYARNR
jgi:DNA processing protein